MVSNFLAVIKERDLYQFESFSKYVRDDQPTGRVSLRPILLDYVHVSVVICCFINQMLDATLPFPAFDQMMNRRARVAINIVNKGVIQGYIPCKNSQHEMFPNVTTITGFFGVVVTLKVGITHDQDT